MPISPRGARRQDRAAGPCRDEPQDTASTPVPDRHPRSIHRAGDAAGILPDDLYDYYTVEPDPQTGSPRAAGKMWRVTDDWPERVPVTEAEIEVFERWFADLFDEMFGPTGR